MVFRFATLLSLLGAAVSAHATILTFDQDLPISNAENVQQTYGDNVTATTMGLNGYGVGAEGFTPNVTVAYGPSGADPALWTTGYGNLTNVLFEDNDNFGVLDITFTAAAGQQVVLYGFDMAAYAPVFTGDPSINSLTVRDGNGATLFSSTNPVISRTTRTTFDFSARPYAASTLVLSFNTANLGGLSDDIAFDNIRFGQQPVPEPATMAALGLGAFAVLRRRRR